MFVNMDKMINLNARLTTEMAIAVKVAAAKTGKSIQELIADALRAHPPVKKELK